MMETAGFPFGSHALELSGPDPFGSMGSEDVGTDINVQVQVLAPTPWTLNLVVHDDWTVTKPSSATDITAVMVAL